MFSTEKVYRRVKLSMYQSRLSSIFYIFFKDFYRLWANTQNIHSRKWHALSLSPLRPSYKLTFLMFLYNTTLAFCRLLHCAHAHVNSNMYYLICCFGIVVYLEYKVSCFPKITITSLYLYWTKWLII